jgi:hypothetical protein
VKNQYCGDVGDLSKFALLRSLQNAFPEERIGILWYLTPDHAATGAGKDGRFIDYPELEHCDPELYRVLQAIAHGRRDISEFRRLGLTRGISEYYQQLDSAKHASKTREQAREAWFQGALHATADCSLIFVDPDNGIASDRVKPTQVQRDKFALHSELEALHARGQTVLCYQHANRLIGFDQFLAKTTSRFPGSFAIRWRRLQSRAYLVWPSRGRELRPWARAMTEGSWRAQFTLGPAWPS